MKNLLTTDKSGKYFIVACDYDKWTVALLKKCGGRWNPDKKFWTIEVASLNNNFSMVREVVKYAGLEVKPGAAGQMGRWA